jgi:hypothetical protein
MTPYTQDFTQTQSIAPSQGQTVRQKRIKQAIDYTILEVSEPETRGYSSGSAWTVENSKRFRFKLLKNGAKTLKMIYSHSQIIALTNKFFKNVFYKSRFSESFQEE